MVEKPFLFSAEEVRIMMDREFLIAKRSIIDKVVYSLSEVQRQIAKTIADRKLDFPNGTFARGGKVSKGENYKGLPYVVLDYPRLFSSHSTFSYRVVFWWGHYFLSSLHLEGNALLQYQPTLLTHVSKMKSEVMKIKTDGSPWEHDLYDQHWKSTQTMTDSDIADAISNSSMIRVAIDHSISEHEHLEERLVSDFEALIGLIN